MIATATSARRAAKEECSFLRKGTKKLLPAGGLGPLRNRVPVRKGKSFLLLFFKK
jgi:hypothetical protein